MQKPKIIVILGQTATGKSDLAVQIAKKFKGAVISADSRQVYKGLDIGSGKITKKEMRGVKHHCLSYASPKKIHTISEFKKCAERAIYVIARRKLVPIICGGTGLYIDVLLNNIELPVVKPNPKLRANLEKLNVNTLFKRLYKLDSKRAETLKNNGGYKNKRRLIRALEIIDSTKKPIDYFGDGDFNNNLSESPYDILYIGIKIPDNKLKKRIRDRLLKRVKNGLIKEVKDLHYETKIKWKTLYNLGLEYRYVSLYLQKLITKEELLSQLENKIWQYAKRQKTWFKRNSKINWIKNKNEAVSLVKVFLKQ
ncbi:MAG: tRNA (adenosine(37)-N6)-dimethylallyltransferase MiaA [bacterium]|nr:tRNA (adenosine(37)-N6)-dimethylallyltransferase MiaA [bacterium]